MHRYSYSLETSGVQEALKTSTKETMELREKLGKIEDASGKVQVCFLIYVADCFKYIDVRLQKTYQNFLKMKLSSCAREYPRRFLHEWRYNFFFLDHFKSFDYCIVCQAETELSTLKVDLKHTKKKMDDLGEQLATAQVALDFFS